MKKKYEVTKTFRCTKEQSKKYDRAVALYNKNRNKKEEDEMSISDMFRNGAEYTADLYNSTFSA